MRIVMNRTRSGRMMVAGFVVLAMAAGTRAAEYYVDGRSGDDANDGRSAERAFRTLKTVSARSILSPARTSSKSPLPERARPRSAVSLGRKRGCF